MMELAHHGSDVLETRSVELAKKYNVQLFFGKAMESDKSKGTYIMNREKLLVEEMPITGMSIQEDVVIFTLREISNEGPAVAEVFRTLADMEINIDMISQQSTGEDTCSVSFSCISPLWCKSDFEVQVQLIAYFCQGFYTIVVIFTLPL